MIAPGVRSFHENDAAQRLCALCENEHMVRGQVKEGKLELSAAIDGLFRVDTARLREINLLEDIMIATRHGGRAVRKGDKLCGTRVIPLVVEEEKLRRAEEIGGGPSFQAAFFIIPRTRSWGRCIPRTPDRARPRPGRRSPHG